MKSIEITSPVTVEKTQVLGLFCQYKQRRIAGKPPIHCVTLKLTKPLDGETTLTFYPGEPGYEELALALDIEQAMNAALVKRFPHAVVKDITTKEDKPVSVSTPKASSKKSATTTVKTEIK